MLDCQSFCILVSLPQALWKILPKLNENVSTLLGFGFISSLQYPREFNIKIACIWQLLYMTGNDLLSLAYKQQLVINLLVIAESYTKRHGIVIILMYYISVQFSLYVDVLLCILVWTYCCNCHLCCCLLPDWMCPRAAISSI